MPRFTADGPSLYYDVQGAGDPVVLLHGFTSLGTSWQRLGWLDVLVESGFETITLDFRSHGRSDRVYDASECSTEKLAADVISLLDHREIEQASLFGFSHVPLSRGWLPTRSLRPRPRAITMSSAMRS